MIFEERSTLHTRKLFKRAIEAPYLVSYYNLPILGKMMSSTILHSALSPGGTNEDVVTRKTDGEEIGNRGHQGRKKKERVPSTITSRLYARGGKEKKHNRLALSLYLFGCSTNNVVAPVPDCHCCKKCPFLVGYRAPSDDV